MGGPVKPLTGLRASLLTTGLGILLGTASSAQVTEMVSVPNGAGLANGLSWTPTMSFDGRYVVFSSDATNLVPGDTNGFQDIFLRDRAGLTTELISAGLGGGPANSSSGWATMSDDGRFVAFFSSATNLVASDTNFRDDVFVRDRLLGITELVSVSSAGVQGDGHSQFPTISADGRYVAFASYATNLVPGDTNQTWDCFVRDRLAGTTELVSLSSSGAIGDDSSGGARISADGRFVSFNSLSRNFFANDHNDTWDVFVRDRLAQTTELVSLSTSGATGDRQSDGSTISGDGRFVAFESQSTDLVSSDSNGWQDVFVRDRLNGTTELVSFSQNGTQGNSFSFLPVISRDGRFVAFGSAATNLDPLDTDGLYDAFVRDRLAGTTEWVSRGNYGLQPNGQMDEHLAISGDGRFVAFSSQANDLVTGDTNATQDVFVRDRLATTFLSLCDPGVAGVIPCPCANPPSSAGRGCDNSSATGGASIAASGGAYVSLDSLVFTTSGENPFVTSILLQGRGFLAGGAIYGQGVRCVGGTLKRLFTSAASGGSVTVPDFAVGDPTVSSRSAAKGDVIQGGESRWYLVYYRDPTVLGGCPATSTFNSTATEEIDWSY